MKEKGKEKSWLLALKWSPPTCFWNCIYSDAILARSLSTLTVQTLAIMLREMEGEPARLDLLSDEK